MKIVVSNNAVLVPVTVRDRQLDFLLDTGSEQSAIDATVAKSLGMQVTGTQKLLKDYRAVDSDVVIADRLVVAGRSFDGERLSTLDLTQLSRGLGHPIEGVLGNDVLGRLVFTVNYSKQKLVVDPKRGRWGSAINLRRSGDEYFIPLTLVSQRVELLLDSGTNSTNLSWNTWQSVSQSWKPVSIVDGIVRAGTPAPSSFFVCLPSVSFAGIQLNDQAVRIQRSVESGAFASQDFGGILGSDVLRAFEVTFDLSNSRIYLKKDPDYRPNPYRFSTIGVQFARGDDGYVIMSVWRNSPADHAGIRPGDVIKSVNGEPAAAMSAEQLSKEMHGEPGTPVQLLIGRNGLTEPIALRTRQLLCDDHKDRGHLEAVTK